MKTARRVVWLFLLIVFVSAWSRAENDREPLSLLRPAFEKIDQAKGAHTRFTFLDLNHNMNFNEKGKKSADETPLYDVTYIGDQQYSRLLEIDGKPLTGKEIAQEQERYDDAGLRLRHHRFDPLPGASQRRYRFWVDPAKEEVMTMESTVIADDGDKLKGSTFRLQYTYIDGIPLISHSHIDATLLMGKKRVHVVTDHTYSNFRKFSVTTTIVPVESEGKK